jgi:hypothetical protein
VKWYNSLLPFVLQGTSNKELFTVLSAVCTDRLPSTGIILPPKRFYLPNQNFFSLPQHTYAGAGGKDV